jgi:hypothetical protein
MKSRVSHEPINPNNDWQFITYLGGESSTFNITIQGRYIGQTNSLSAAKRMRDEALNGPPEPALEPISPQSYGYFEHERIAK